MPTTRCHRRLRTCVRPSVGRARRPGTGSASVGGGGDASMTAPRAVGVRMPYADVPGHVRAWVDEVLGSPVATWADQVGGMSPGCATRVAAADGSRAFVKAV